MKINKMINFFYIIYTIYIILIIDITSISLLSMILPLILMWCNYFLFNLGFKSITLKYCEQKNEKKNFLKIKNMFCY